MNYSIVISICSLLLAIYSNLSKNNKENNTALTTVIVKLESISEGVADIKREINELKDDQKADHDKIVKLEASLDSLKLQIQGKEAAG